MRHALRELALWIGRIAALAVLVGGVALWRLSDGPVNLDALLPVIEPYLAVDRDTEIDVGGLELALTEERDRVELRARNVRVREGGGARAEFPQVGVGFSPRALLEGKLRPVRLSIDRPKIALIRDRQGRISVSSADEGAAGSGAIGVLDAVRKPADDADFLGRLERVDVTGADLTIADEAEGRRFHAANAMIRVTRAEGRIEAAARLALDAGSGPVPVEGTARLSPDGTTAVSLRLPDLRPARLAELDARLAPLAAIDGTATVSMDTTLTSDNRFGTAALRVDGGPVSVKSGDGVALALDTLRLDAVYDATAHTMAINALSAQAKDVSLTGKGSVDTAGGGGTLDLALGDGTLTLQALRTAGGERIEAVLRRVDPRALAGLSPALALLSQAALPLNGVLSADVSSDFQPKRLVVDVSNAGGTLAMPGHLQGPLTVASLAARLDADVANRKLTIDRFDLRFENAVDGPSVGVSGSVGDDGKTFDMNITAAVTAMPVDSLARYWPFGVKANVREWLTTNLAHGVLDRFEITAGGLAPSGHLEDFDLTQLGGGFTGHGIDVRYLKGLPPIAGVERVEGAFHARTLEIRTFGGAVRDVTAGDGLITIVNLGTPREDIDIRVPMKGPARTVLEVLNEEPLGYLNRIGMDPESVKGEVASADLRFAFPLFETLKLEDVLIDVTAKTSNLAVAGVVGGRDLTDGALTLQLDTKSLTTKGKGKIVDLPVSIEWKEIFDPQPKEPRTRVVVRGKADAPALERFGLRPPAGVTGTADLTAVLSVDRQKKQTLSVEADLKKTTLALRPLGWNKPEGTSATLKASTVLSGRKGAGYSVDLSLSGGGMDASGTLILDGASAVQGVRSGRVLGGQHDFGIEMSRDGDLYRVTVTGRSLDARPAMEDMGKDGDSRLPPMDLTVNLDGLVFGDKRKLSKVAGHLRRSAERWSTFDVVAKDTTGAGVAAKLQPDGTFTVGAENAGAALDSLDLTDRIKGGTLSIAGKVGPEDAAPLDGTIQMTDYVMLDAPVLGHILSAMSLGGMLQLLRGEGLTFGKLDGRFHKAGSVITVSDLRTAGGALGLTLDGDLDLGRKKVAMRGTIVPVYGINRIIGQIPVLGDLLSGGEGQGIFAATWDVSGSISDPSVSVNPLAVLAPGFLRNLFFL